MDDVESTSASFAMTSNQIGQFGQFIQFGQEDLDGLGEHDSDGSSVGFTVEVAKAPRPPLSEEELYERGRTLFLHNPSYMNVFLDTVDACDGEIHTLGELEERIASLPGYAKLKNPPYFPVSWLKEAGALEELYLDANGKIYEAKDLVALDEDAFDDLVEQYAFRATDNGRKLVSEFSPMRRLASLLEGEPARRDTYLEVLEFLREKRSFAEIERLLRGRDVLTTTAEEGVTLQPSMFVDKLEAAGAIAFDGGWMTTAQGKEMLDTIKKA